VFSLASGMLPEGLSSVRDDTDIRRVMPHFAISLNYDDEMANQ
jgi:hypothetical protein